MPASSLLVLAALALPAGASPPPPAERAAGSIGRDCPGFRDLRWGPGPDDIGDCLVSQSGSLGAFAGTEYSYALYCVVPRQRLEYGRCEGAGPGASYVRARALAVFEGAPGAPTVRLAFESASADVGLFVYPEKPRLVRRPEGLLFHLPVALDGPSGENASEYWRWTGRSWRKLDAASWLAELKRRLPKDKLVRKGVWPDLDAMTARVPLYRASDELCCPTNGAALARLGIEGDRLVLASLELSR